MLTRNVLMKNSFMPFNRIYTFFSLLCVVLCVTSGCTDRKARVSFMKADFDNIYLTYTDTVPITLYFDGLDSMNVAGNDTFSLKDVMDRLSIEKGKRYAIAYDFCQKGYYALHIKANNKMGELLADTMLKTTFPTVTGKCVEEPIVVRGDLCPYILQNSYNGDRKIPIRNWLFDADYPLDSLLISKMEGAVNYLCGIAYPTYCLSQEHNIPRLTSIQNSPVSVRTNMQADRYFLFAASSASALLEKIKQVVRNNHVKGLFKSRDVLTGIPLNSVGIGDVVSIFLVGINDDDTYSILPVGAYIVDKSAPISLRGRTWNYAGVNYLPSSSSPLIGTQRFSSLFFDFRNIGFIVRHEVDLQIDGCVVLSHGNFGGDMVDGVDIPFTLNSRGDIKRIEIFRTKRNEWGVRPGKRTIEVNGQTLSNYHFDYTLLLRFGDNYVPVIVTDMRGNKTKMDYYIPVARVSNNSDEDEIENLQSQYDDLEGRISELERNN